MAAELQNLGGARVIQATATNAQAITASVGGLDCTANCLPRRAGRPGQVSPMPADHSSGTVHGHPAGTSNDLVDPLNLAALQSIKPMVEVMPLEKAADGYQRIMANQARFRVVLTTEEARA